MDDVSNVNPADTGSTPETGVLLLLMELVTRREERNERAGNPVEAYKSNTRLNYGLSALSTHAVRALFPRCPAQ